MAKQKTVDDYIASFPNDMQPLLRSVRMTIRENAPEAEESIAYAMPAYKLNDKPLVYFAGLRMHVGFYAVPTTIKAFRKELEMYLQGKGSVQLPVSQPMPLDLIGRMVRFRAEEITTAKTE